jgi:hypothetical protein
LRPHVDQTEARNAPDPGLFIAAIDSGTLKSTRQGRAKVMTRLF